MNPPFARNAAGLEDPTTAARHLAAALGVLKSDGRLVAIMPDSFQPHGRRAELFQRALQGASVAFHARLEGAFAKQGTDRGPLAGDRQVCWFHQHHRHQPGYAY
jgi:hypothetical protein